MHQTGVEDNVSYLLYRVGRLLRYNAAQFFAQRDVSISPEQWGLLLKIAANEPASLSSLVDPALNDHPNLTRLVAALEEMGYVRRVTNPNDRRGRLISISEQGRILIADLSPYLAEQKQQFFEGLSEREVEMLYKMLKVLEKNME